MGVEIDIIKVNRQWADEIKNVEVERREVEKKKLIWP